MTETKGSGDACVTFLLPTYAALFAQGNAR
jgi:hypothetical protein